MLRTRDRVAALLERGMTRAAIARELGLTKSTVAYHARRLGVPMNDRCSKRYDWGEIQRYYDEGHSITACQARFGFSREAWNGARKRGAVVSRPQAMPLEQLLCPNCHSQTDNFAGRNRRSRGAAAAATTRSAADPAPGTRSRPGWTASG